MDKNELLKLYYQKDKEFEAAKGKRTILTILLFAVGYFVIICVQTNPTNWKDICGNLLASIFIAGIHFWFNSIIFLKLFNKSNAENAALERIRKEISELEKKEQNP